MKKVIFIVILLFQMQETFAQKQMSKVFDGKTKIVFLGLDFTQAKFIGEEGFKDPYKLKTYYLSNWNALLEEEYAKYNLPLNSLKARHYETNTSDLMVLNDEIEDIEDAIINGSHYIDDKDVQKSVRKYKLSDNKGIGVSFVVESFNISLEKAIIWVTFVNMSNGTLLYTERMEGKAEGFGLRNFWAGSIYDIIEQIRLSRYKVWKRKF
jgi:hypothetical protein